MSAKKTISDFYSTNKDFKEYVDKFASKHNLSTEKALAFATVKMAYEYYEDIENSHIR